MPSPHSLPPFIRCSSMLILAIFLLVFPLSTASPIISPSLHDDRGYHGNGSYPRFGFLGVNYNLARGQPYIKCEYRLQNQTESGTCKQKHTYSELTGTRPACGAIIQVKNAASYLNRTDTYGMELAPEQFEVVNYNCYPDNGMGQCKQEDKCLALVDDHILFYKDGRAHCCCIEHMCNGKIVVRFVSPAPETTSTIAPKEEASRSVWWWILIPVVVIFIAIALGVCFWRRKQRRPIRDLPSKDEQMELIEKRELLNANIDIIELLAHGKIAKIEKVRLTDRTTGEERIAVLKSTDYTNFRKEEIVFGLLANGHQHVAHLIGVHTEPKENLYQLVLKIEELGDLATYLQTSVWSFTDTVKFMASFMDGLDYIHTPISRPNGRSYTIAHRDIKSRNVLVRADRTAVITDFNCAQLLDTHRGFKQGKIHQKGTFHYMAPEALKAFNCNVEGYTKIDIYAAALIFWELLNRTQMDAEDQILPAQIPFTTEIEEERAIEEERFLNAPDYNPRETFQPKPVQYILIRLVNDEGKRPIFREKLRIHLASKRLIDSITFMWDHEGEVRLTAAGARNRFKELLEYIKEPMDSYDYPNNVFHDKPANLYYPPTQYVQPA